MVALPPAWFETRTSGDGSRAVLSLAGELDCATVEQAYAELKLAAALTDTLTIDPTGLTFSDTSALHFLLYARELFPAPERELLIVGGNARVSRLLELGRIADRFTFVEPR